MMSIRIVDFGVVGRFAAWMGIVFLVGSAVGPAAAKPLPPRGVDEFRALLVQDSSIFGDVAESADALLQRRRDLIAAAQRLPSLGEVTRVLLLPDWSSAEFDSFDSPAKPEEIEAAVRQRDDKAFKRAVGKLLKKAGEDSSRVAGAISAQLKRDLRERMLDRLQERLRFYLASRRPADRIAAANLISDAMGNARRQDNQELPTSMKGERRGPGLSSSFLRQRLRALSGDLRKLVRDGDTSVQVASIRALSNLEGDTAKGVATLQPLLTSRQSSLPARRATAEAFAHMVDIVYLHMQADKSRPKPPLRDLARIFPAAASGLGDADAQVRRSCLAACQEAATALDELVGERGSSFESLAVYQPMLRVVQKSLPDLNLGARDRVPELRVAACHLLETLAMIAQKTRHRISSPEPFELDQKPGKGVRKSSPSPGRSVRRSVAPSSNGGMQRVAFLARRIDELPPPTPMDTSLRDTVRAMISGLNDPDYRVRLASVDVLETFGQRAAPAIPGLVKVLRDSNKFVRWSAARTLGRLVESAKQRKEAEKVVVGLMRLLSDREDLSVRITALSTLEKYGPSAKAAVPLLARVINRGDKEYVIAVLHTLQGIGTDAQRALPNVAWILRSRELPTSVRVEAAQTLGRFGALAKGQLRELREIMVKDADEAVRDAASSAVLAIDRPK